MGTFWLKRAGVQISKEADSDKNRAVVFFISQSDDFALNMIYHELIWKN
jgi:hypothetical protein